MSNLYRKKPVLIEARKFDAHDMKGASEIYQWIATHRTDATKNATLAVVEGSRDECSLVIETLESNAFTVSDGDYVIRGVKGEFYACKPDIFEVTYEPETEDADNVFKGFGKIPRLNRNISITEKIDGTNACVVILDNGDVLAQSRNRMITVEDDNAGFAKWVAENAADLKETLGAGYHYGEWWGSGINRGYGATKGEKFFSVFNAGRWTNEDFVHIPNMYVVPILYEGPFDQAMINFCIENLRTAGSLAKLGYMKPEGIIVWHEAARQMFKVTLEDDEKPKGSKE